MHDVAVPSRRDLPPTPAELVAWLAVAPALVASGVYVSEATVALFGYASSGDPPVVVAVPPGRPVTFAHEVPDRWRLEVDGELLAVSDGTIAVGVALPSSAGEGEVLQVGTRLQLVHGPDVLLRPDPPVPPYDELGQPRRGQPAVGEVAADELLGRPCWRWSSPYGTRWLDAATGVQLRVVTPELDGRFLELDLGAIGGDAFAVPADLLARAVAVPDPFGERRGLLLGPADVDVEPVYALDPEPMYVPDPGPRPMPMPTPWDPVGATTAPAPVSDTDFTVCWWPEPPGGRLVRGDPDVPEVLVQLDTGGPGTRFWLGVAPAGRPAPALDPEADDVQVHRWDGDGWTFALSWQDEVSREDLDRLVASVPRSWA